MGKVRPSEPTRLQVEVALGALTGGTARYEKRLSDLVGLYRDEAAFEAVLAASGSEPVYWVESSTLDTDDGALTIGVSTVAPGRIGDEYAMTRGHIHGHHAAAELYYGLSGRGVMLLETLAGESRAIEVVPGVAVHVPGHWVHRSINVGREPFSTLFCYPSNAGQDYEVIARAGGMRQLVVAGDAEGWRLRDNPNHGGYGA
jgi:glucose-6-phosphate isomerase, archaeal